VASALAYNTKWAERRLLFIIYPIWSQVTGIPRDTLCDVCISLQPAG